MKKLLLLTLLCISIYANAQPTITTNQLPYAGLAYINANDTSFTGPIPAGGANQTWNYASLLSNDYQDTIGFIAAAGTPYASDFPTANLASHSPQDSLYIYFITNNNGFYVKGFRYYGVNSGLPVNKITFTPSYLFMPVPFTYLNSQNSYTRFVIDIDTALPYIRVIHRVNQVFTADGYGTVQLPNSVSYSNVLRVKDVETTYDSILADPLGFGVYIPLSNTASQLTNYLHVRQAQPALIFSITADSLGNNGSSASWYTGGSTASVEENASTVTNVQVYPNPASEIVYVMLPEPAKENSLFRLYDVQGRVVRETPFEGIQNYAFYVNNLQKGVYFWKIEGMNSSGKLVVE